MPATNESVMCQSTIPAKRVTPESDAYYLGRLIADGPNTNATPPLMVAPAPLASDVAIVRPSDPNTAICGLTTYDAPPESSRRSRERPVKSSLAHARLNDSDIPSRGLA